MKINLFLDDIRTPNMSHALNKGLGEAYSDTNKWVIVRDYFEFVDIINNRFDDIQLISFDHDLACFKDGIEYTGKTAADYVMNFCLDNNKQFPDWYAHTDNTSGRNNIIGIIINYLDKVEGYDISDFRYFHRGIVNNKMIW